MTTPLGSLRRLVLAPSLREVTAARRGFPVDPGAAAVAHLEAVPQAVVCGFEWGIEARDQWEVQRRVELVAAPQRGFVYEGVVMACTVRDAMRGGRGHRARDLVLGPAQPHIFLTYIGIGFALARLPRALWRAAVPDLTGSAYHPTMDWLIVDGYGFDRAYFDTRRWVQRQYVPPAYPWRGARDYFPRAVDQGIGRALWFIHGGAAPAAAAAVDRFASHRRADLWSGLGLAAAFAGGCDAAGLAALRRLAGQYRPYLAQGAVFAAKARHFSGCVPDYSQAAVAALTDLTVPAAAALADDATTSEVDGGAVPAYELWRARIRAGLAREPADR